MAVSAARGRAARNAYYWLYDRNGFPPTVREVARALGVTSSHTAFMALCKAADLGLLVYRPNRRPAFLPLDGDMRVAIKTIAEIVATDPANPLSDRINHVLQAYR